MSKQSDKPLQPVYLIYGKEPFLLEEALSRLRARLERESPVGLDVRLFSGASVDPQEILSALETLPLMSERRLVIIKEADKLSSTAEAAIVGYVRNPSETSCLVLVSTDIKKERRLYKAVDAKGETFEFKLPGKGHYPLWIQNRFVKRGKRVDVEGANFLLQEVGFDLFRLDNEIEKICLFYDNLEMIGAEEMGEILSPSRESGVYDFVDALGERNSLRAVLLLRRLLERDEKGTSIFYPLLRHFKALLKTKAYWEKGVRGAELLKALKVSPFLAKKYQSQIRNFSLEELKTIYLLLAEMDFSAKGDGQELGMALEIMASRIGNLSEAVKTNSLEGR